MKKFLAFLLCVIFLVAPVLAAGNPWDDYNMITLPTAPKANIIIDGIRDDGYGDWYNLDQFSNEIGGATGRFCSAWNETGIFYYVEVYDTTPNHEYINPWAPWERDSVDFYIDWNANFGDVIQEQGDNPAWQIRINSAPSKDGNQNSGTFEYDTFEAGIDFVARPINGDYKNGYILEICLPIVLAGENAIPLSEGRELFVDFMIHDNQYGEGRTSQTLLVPDDEYADEQWQYPYAFRGILPLGSSKIAPAAEPEPESDGEVAEDNPSEEEPDPVIFEIPEPKSVVPSSQKVIVNGKDTPFDAYNIDGSNYIKLRDMAYAINGTEKQFGVDYDAATNTILLASNTPYKPNGSEMADKSSSYTTIVPSPQKITLDGKEVSFMVYNIDGSNYFKLRDVMKTFDVFVGWDGATNTVTLDTSKGYVD